MGRNDRSAESDKGLGGSSGKTSGGNPRVEGGRAIRRSTINELNGIDESPPDAHETHNEWNGVFDEVVV